MIGREREDDVAACVGQTQIGRQPDLSRQLPSGPENRKTPARPRSEATLAALDHHVTGWPQAGDDLLDGVAFSVIGLASAPVYGADRPVPLQTGRLPPIMVD